MYSLEDIKRRSESTDELIVNYTDALELLYLYENDNTEVIGWEGWIKSPDGSLTHSRRYQGKNDFFRMSKTSTIALIKSTIMQSYVEWDERPEVNGADLLYCIKTCITSR